jgi:large subunit ribosomal protein L6
MSRIGKMPIRLGTGVSVEKLPGGIRVKGPKGTLSASMPRGISVEIADGTLTFARPDDRKQTRALHGLARALVANMVKGVVEPFRRELEIQGVGYRAEVKGRVLELSVGFSHPVPMPIPDGLTVSVERNVAIRIEGIDRAKVGQFAANVRRVRPPEPYKGKGIRYLQERVRRKVGKAGGATTA